MIDCPHCNGAGIVTVVWQGLPEAAADATECPMCNATGQITEAHAQRAQLGQAMRKARIACGVSLREEAIALGMSPRQLRDKEWGREE